MQGNDRQADVARALARYRPLIDDWDAFVESASRPLPVCIWTNESRLTPQELVALLAEERIEAATLSWNAAAFRLGRIEGLGNRWWYQAGLCHGQEEVSMLPVACLAPQPGDRILDLCAAPGGKTSQLAQAVGPDGTVIANEISVSRLRALNGILDRLGLVNVTLTNHDGRRYPLEAGPFDRVLVDPPCSDQGTVRKNPKLLDRMPPHPPLGLTSRQKGLLRMAVRLCRPGGRIAYSTCTFSPEENEAVVDTVLRDDPASGLRLVEVRPAGLQASEGLTSWNGVPFDPSLRHALRVWPHQNDTGGFFVAVLEKGDGPPVEETSTAIQRARDGEWMPYASERYEMPASIWKELLVHRRTSRGLHVTNRLQRAPVAPQLHAVGRLLVKDRIKYPKLTTAGALLLGGQARRNFVELTREQVQRYTSREIFSLEPGQDERCDGDGYVVVRHRGFALGTGYRDTQRGELRSLFPRRWAT